MSLAKATCRGARGGQWWGQLSAWRKMFVWAGIAFVVVHLALAARLFVGQWEAREIRALRARNVFVQYVWEKKPERFFLDHWLLAGMHGKSCASVIDLRLPEIATDADLELIGQYFHHLRYLNAENSKVTSQGVLALRGCPQLEWLKLSGTELTSEGLSGLRDCTSLIVLDANHTDIGDEGLRHLAKLKKLRAIGLAGTLVTDAAIPILSQLPDLQPHGVHVAYTDVSQPKAGVTRPNWLEGHRWEGGMTGEDNSSTQVIGSIRWSDGDAVRQIPRPL